MVFFKRAFLLIASSVLIGVGPLSATATAHDPEWYSFGETLQGVSFTHGTGEIAVDFGGSGFVSGPCEITMEGSAHNSFGAARATIGEVQIQNECETNVPGCTITPAVSNLPWSLRGTTVTEAAGVEISSMFLTLHFMGGSCPVPFSPISASGTGTALLTSPECISFEGHQDDLWMWMFPSVPVNLTGEFCFFGPNVLG